MNSIRTANKHLYSHKRRYIAIISIFLLAFIYLLVQIPVSDSYNNSTYVLSKVGSRGSEVRQIQTKLKNLGYYKGTIDGIYGNNTKSAVTAFQKSCGLKADGIAGPQTLLYLGLGSSASSSSGLSSNDIYLLAKVIEGEDLDLTLGNIPSKDAEKDKYANTMPKASYNEKTNTVI